MEGEREGGEREGGRGEGGERGEELISAHDWINNPATWSADRQPHTQTTDTVASCWPGGYSVWLGRGRMKGGTYCQIREPPKCHL